MDNNSNLLQINHDDDLYMSKSTNFFKLSLKTYYKQNDFIIYISKIIYK